MSTIAMHPAPVMTGRELKEEKVAIAAPEAAQVDGPDLTPFARNMAVVAIVLGYAWLAAVGGWLYFGMQQYRNFR